MISITHNVQWNKSNYDLNINSHCYGFAYTCSMLNSFCSHFIIFLLLSLRIEIERTVFNSTEISIYFVSCTLFFIELRQKHNRDHYWTTREMCFVGADGFDSFNIQLLPFYQTFIKIKSRVVGGKEKVGWQIIENWINRSNKCNAHRGGVCVRYIHSNSKWW